MQYIVTPYAEKIEPWVWWEGAFTEQELNYLQDKALKAQEAGQVGGTDDQEKLSQIRRSAVSWVENTTDTEWIYRKLSHVVSSLNSQFYRFDLTGFGERLQLTNYRQDNQGMYGWHQDYGGDRQASRKFSLVLQLTDPADYEGGNLQIMVGREPQTVRKQRGLIAAFPSYTVHQVTPVVSGSRQSLVAWVTGPAFK